ncbi:MAG: transglycosylase domain-containing protein [Gammaproteobacteria bacterium]
MARLRAIALFVGQLAARVLMSRKRAAVGLRTVGALVSRRRALCVAVGLLAVGAALWAASAGTAPDFASVKSQWTPSEAYLLDRNGAVLDEQRMDFKVRRFDWVPLSGVSPALIAAILDGEDRHFWEHRGVDWGAMLAALRDQGVSQRRRGASTISMQVAALLDPRVRAGASSGAWKRKLAQIRMARALEARWTKPQILEAYLNLLGFRGELQGIGATSRMLVGKAPSGLSLPESLVLAALLPAPRAPIDRVDARACSRAAARHVSVDCASVRETASAILGNYSGTHEQSAGRTEGRTAARDGGLPDLTIEPALVGREGAPRLSRHTSTAGVAAASLAPQLAYALLRKPGERVRTTLDINLQRLAMNALREHLAGLSSRNVRDGAALVVENETGHVLAYVGSAGPASRARNVDGVRARRQAGSTLKPFLYELALERRYLTAASLLDDSPITLDTASGIYLPQDYDRDFKGLVSVRTALGSSLNVPAVRALVLVGVEPFRERLHALGYAGITRPGDFYGFSLALGSAEVSLWEQVQAYRILARGGQGAAITAVALKSPQSPGGLEMDPDSSFIVSDILSDRAARTVTFGLDNHLNTPFWSAVKTGTSKDMRDNWCIGFSRRFTVGVWVGNFEGDSMHDVSGVTGAAPVWHDIMMALHARLPSPAPIAPPNVVTTLAKFSPAVEPARNELLLSNITPSRPPIAGSSSPPPGNTTSHPSHTTSITVASEIARIASPANGMIIAIDPDIPSKHQRVPLSARGAADGAVLRLNGSLIGPAQKSVMWPPQRGTYLLALEDSAGHTLDSARFTVR